MVSELKSIWDNSIEQYQKCDFKTYWELLPIVFQYQNRCMTGDEGTYGLSYAMNYVKEHIGDKNLRGLAIGCNESGPEMTVFETGVYSKIEVMDIAQGLLKKQSRIASEKGLNAIEYIKQDLNCVELEKNTYDFIWAVGTVHHIENLELFFAQVQNALKDNGIFMMREYIGPNRINYTEEQLSIVNEILSILPEKYKKTPEGFIKNMQEPTDVAGLIKIDPSESVRSEDIMQILNDELEIVKLAYTGGTILQPLLSNIASNFEKDQEADLILNLLILLEKTLIEKRVLPSDYVFCMAKKKSSSITQIRDTANVVSSKDSAMNLKACSKGLETIIKEKDVHINNIEAELNLIKQSKVWRIAEFFRRLFYLKLSGKTPLLQKGMLTISREGIPVFFAKTKRYLRKNKDVATMGLIESDYDKWIKKNELTDEMIGEIKREITRFEYKPKISILMPVYNVDQTWLEKAIDSVMNQLYENWELCIADDASQKKYIKQVLERYSGGEERIKIKYLKENQGVSRASNEALRLATGEFVGLLDNDDELTIDALYENVKFLNKSPEADLIYSDEDKTDTRGNRTEPFFKPDYSPDFLLTKNYICHFSLFRRSIINDIGGFRKWYEGSQDYDLILRFIEKTKPERIFHIPKILYHWRKIPGSAATRVDAKSYAFASAKKALLDYLKRNSIQGKVVDGNCSSYRVMREVKNNYKVSIIIPFKDQSEVLRTCVNSIIGRTKYREYEIVLVNNQSKEEETFEYLDKIKDNSSFRILDYDNSFNFSAINNYAVSKVDSEYIVLLNNDTEVISPDWIENMLEFAQREDVGVVGALLYYPNDTIQHGGVILGIKGVAGHSHKHMKRDSHGYFGRIKIVHNLSAVTAACLMTKKSIFKEVDGFDVNFSHAFNDVDYCLKIREKGYLIVYTPYAELYHHESLSRGYEDTPEKQARFRKEIELFQRKWKDVLTKGDPYYNPNLTLEREDFSIRI